MKKFLKTTRSGSALLIAILVMGVLMVLTLGLSDLVIREIRQSSDAVAVGKAYFAAEAGIENALLDLHQNIAGYEIVQPKDAKNVDLHFQYSILNSADRIPYFEPDRAVFLHPGDAAISSNAIYDIRPDATYNVLGLHQNVVIPLSGPSGDVKDFLLEYYFDPDPEHKDIFLSNSENFNNLDVLRWKVFGYPKAGNAFDTRKTDAISDFYPGLFGNRAEAPVCIGTDPSLVSQTSNTLCKYPSPLSSNALPLDAAASPVSSAQNPLPNSNWGAARECYSSDAGTPSSSDLADVQQNCTIRDFVNRHSQNYLVLTNVVNPELIGLSTLDTDLSRANIYYRIIAKPGADQPKLVRESAVLHADGFAAEDKVHQSIDANIGLSSFLPVFHFSLYRTDSTK